MSDAVSVRKRDVVAYTSPERLIGLKTLSPARTLSQQQASQKFPKTCSYDTPGRAAVHPRHDFVGLSRCGCSGATNYLSTVASSPMKIVN